MQNLRELVEQKNRIARINNAKYTNHFSEKIKQKTKAIIILLLLLSLTKLSFSQHIKFNWQSCFEQSGYQKDVYSTSIVYTGDGYLILCCVAKETGGLPTGNVSDIWLIKTDSTGNFLWDKYFGGSLAEDAVSIMAAGDSNYYIFGSTNSIDGGATFPPYLPDGGLWYIKIDSEGNKLWDLVAGSPIPCYGYGASSLVTFDYALFSTVNSCGGGGGNVTNYYGGYDAWFLKINKNGHIDWEFTLGTNGFEDAGVTIQTSDSGFLVPMMCNPGTNGNIICDSSLQSTCIGRAVLVKLDKNLNIQWQNCLGASDHIGFNNALEVTDGYIIGGFACAEDGATSGTGYHEGYNHSGSRTADIWLRKIDFDGNLIWQKCYGGKNDDYVSQLFKTTDGNIMIFGSTDSYDGDITGLHYDPQYPSFASEDVWMLKIKSTNGDLLWNRCIGSMAREFIGNNVLQKDDKNYTLTTQTITGNMGDIICGDPEVEYFAWVYSITDTTAYLGEPKMPDLSKFVNIYPNPSEEFITVEIPSQFTMQNYLAEIIDCKGEIVITMSLTGNNPCLYTGNLPVGLYLLSLNNQKMKLSKRFFKK